MNRYAIYAIASLLFLGVLVATLDRGQINDLRRLVGLEPLYRSGALARGGAEALVDEVAERPVPGVLDDPPRLGTLAKAAAACVQEAGSQTVASGLRRYLLAVAAIGMEREHPLVEPRFAELHPLIGQGPMAALAAAREGRLTDDQRALLAELHATYRDPDHPLYDGLGLHGDTLEGMRFEAAADALAARWDEVADCATAEALPPLARWEALPVR